MELQNKEIEYILDRNRIVLVRDQHTEVLDKSDERRNYIINTYLFDNAMLVGEEQYEPFKTVIKELRKTNRGEI